MLAEALQDDLACDDSSDTQEVKDMHIKHFGTYPSQLSKLSHTAFRTTHINITYYHVCACVAAISFQPFDAFARPSAEGQIFPRPRGGRRVHNAAPSVYFACAGAFLSAALRILALRWFFGTVDLEGAQCKT